MELALKAALDLVRLNGTSERPTAARRIYSDLRQKILSLELLPGTNLLRSELARTYGVSQTPLRDALQRLEQDDLIEIFPQSRTLVTHIDTTKVYEAHFLRVALETEVIRNLARSDTVQDTVRLARSVVELQHELAGDRDRLQQFQELDEYFHSVLFSALGQDSLNTLIRSRSGHLDRVRRLQVHSDEKIKSILDGHEKILDAIERRDETAAMEAIREHLHKPSEWIDQLRVENAAHFA